MVSFKYWLSSATETGGGGGAYAGGHGVVVDATRDRGGYRVTTSFFLFTAAAVLSADLADTQQPYLTVDADKGGRMVAVERVATTAGE